MTIDLTRLTANTQTWAQSTTNADLVVGGVTLTGTAAAAYLFGQALTTVKYQNTLDGVQLNDCRFQFPPGGTQWVSLAEVADALRYKYGIDPLIEFAPGLGVRGYSVPDINAILERLNREFADSFNIALTVSSSAAEVDLQDTFNAEKTAALVSSTGKVATNEYVAFSTNPNWVTGTPVRVAGAGLTAGLDYFARNLGGGNYSFFTSQDSATADVVSDRVTLTPVSSSVTVSFSAVINYTNFSSESIGFVNDPKLPTGTPVRVGTTVDNLNLNANQDYFVRNLGSNRYSFFTSESASLGPGITDRVNLTMGLGGVNVRLSYIPGAASTLLNTASTPILAAATDTELRQSLTDGGDLYTDRFGAFYLNGVRTQAMDVAVTSRLLVQDNVSAEYKVLMDELAERNNLIAAARSVLSGGASGLQAAVFSLGEQYGMADVLSELTAGQFSDSATTSVYRPTSTSVTAAPAAGKVVFATEADPAWSSGTRVRAAATGGGLTAGVDYFVRSLGSGQYSFFSSETQAKASTSNQISTGQIAITGAISGLMIPTFTGVPITQPTWYVPTVTDPGPNEWVKLASPVDWGNSTRVRVDQSGSGLNAGQDYFVKKLIVNGVTYFRFYTDASLTNQVNLTGNVTAGISSDGKVQFPTDPAWPDGTRVQASATGGGLTAGTDYFVRKIGTEYSFFGTAAQAKSSSATGLVILTAPITASITNTTSAADFTSITALLNTLISNKVRDGDLDQAKLQTLTAQLQNNTEAMTALIKAFTDMNAQLARAL